MQATGNPDPSLAEIFGVGTAYEEGIKRIVARAHELAAKDNWPISKTRAKVDARQKDTLTGTSKKRPGRAKKC